MLMDMNNFIRSGGASVSRFLRDKGRVPLQHFKSYDSKVAQMLQNNTGQNLSISDELAQAQGMRAGMKRGAINALTGKSATAVRDFVSSDTGAGMAVRTLVPITTAGVALQAVFGGKPDQQEDSQLMIPGNGQKEGGIGPGEAAAVAALLAGGGVGVGYAGNNAFNDAMFDDGQDMSMPRRPRYY